MAAADPHLAHSKPRLVTSGRTPVARTTTPVTETRRPTAAARRSRSGRAAAGGRPVRRTRMWAVEREAHSVLGVLVEMPRAVAPSAGRTWKRT